MVLMARKCRIPPGRASARVDAVRLPRPRSTASPANGRDEDLSFVTRREDGHRRGVCTLGGALASDSACRVRLRGAPTATSGRRSTPSAGRSSKRIFPPPSIAPGLSKYWQSGPRNALCAPMSLPSADYEDVGVTLIGSFNPAIFHPSWFERHEIISPADAAKSAKTLKVVSPEFSELTVTDIKITVFPDRLQLLTRDASRAERLHDIVLNILSLLPETPITAGGINNSVEFNLNDEDYWHKIGHTLAPKDLIWNDILDDPGMQTLVIKGRRLKDFPGEINVTVQPSPPSRFVYGLRVAVNFHYTSEVDRKVESSADDIASMIETHWNIALGESRIVASRILSRIEKP